MLTVAFPSGFKFIEFFSSKDSIDCSETGSVCENIYASINPFKSSKSVFIPLPNFYDRINFHFVIAIEFDQTALADQALFHQALPVPIRPITFRTRQLSIVAVVGQVIDPFY